MESKEISSSKDFSSIPLNLQDNEKDDVDNAIESSADVTTAGDKALKKKTGSLKRFFSQRKMNTVTADADSEMNTSVNDSKRSTLSKRLGLGLIANQKSKSKSETVVPNTEVPSKSKFSRASTMSVQSSRFRLQGYLSNYWNSVFKKTPVEVANDTQEPQSPRPDAELNVNTADPIHTNPIAATEEN